MIQVFFFFERHSALRIFWTAFFPTSLNAGWAWGGVTQLLAGEGLTDAVFGRGVPRLWGGVASALPLVD